MISRKRTVLFLCTGNSARSQMAEAFTRAVGHDVLVARSAGIEPRGIHPLTPKVMAEKGIDLSMYTSKGFHVADVASSDIVVTLCDDAEKRCPRVPARVDRRHWPLEDPAAASGEDAPEVFRRVRDRIEEHVRALVEEIRARSETS
jgi:arsenate reductase